MTEPCCEHWNKFEETLEWEVNDETDVWYNPSWADVPVKFCPFCGADINHPTIRF
jgi:hypothetical protein